MPQHPIRVQSMMVAMLIMMLARDEEAPPVEAVPMAAARVHEEHVVSSALLERLAAMHSHHALRMTSATAATLRRCAVHVLY